MDLAYRVLSGAGAGRTGTIRLAPGRPAWIGRADESYGTSIVLPDVGVSALHACIMLDPTGWPVICDNRSTNGLLRGGVPVAHATFHSGERFQVGHNGPEVEFYFAEEAGAPDAWSLLPPAPPPPPAHPPPAPPPARPVAQPAVTVRAKRTPQSERARKAVSAEGYVPVERIAGREPIIVYRAKRPGIDHEVMVEVLLHDSEYETPDERRFLRAARLSAKLHHPNVIALYDARITEEYDLLVFESLRGRSFLAEIEEAGRVAPARALAVALDVARGLARIHELGFVHRGLTPESVTITTDGRVKLVTLGLLRTAAHEPEDDGTGTRPGDLLGSIAHMAPEQAANAACVDARADVYGLGAVLYHALAGRPPRADAGALFSSDPPPIGAVAPGTPPALAHLVTRCMARAPEQRFASGAELVAEIERVASHLRPETAPPDIATAPLGPEVPLGARGTPGAPPAPAFPGAPAVGVSSAGFFAGRLKGMQIVELLQMVELHDEAGTLEIMADEGPRGTISFAGGRVVAAACGPLSGEEAAYALLAIKRGYFRLAYGKVAADPAAPAIGAILFEHMRRTDEGPGTG